MILLGSTGHIGSQALSLVKEFKIPVEILACGRNISLLNSQIQQFNPKMVVIQNPRDRHQVINSGCKVFVGREGLKEAIFSSKSPLVLNAIAAGEGVYGSLFATKMNKTLALANKESLVMAGGILDTSKIIPIDSEHFSLWYLMNPLTHSKMDQNPHSEYPHLQKNLRSDIVELIITASGGALRDIPIQQILHKKSKDALQHPNWKMGTKITIDSATMVNKLFELLEAYWLFCHNQSSSHKSSNPPTRLDAIIEKSSHVHALLRHKDGSLTAHINKPDMRLPIAYALNPNYACLKPQIPNLNLEDLKKITFLPIDPKRYPIWTLKEKLLLNPKLGIVLNASNEVLVEYFLQDKITFQMITDILIETTLKYQNECNLAQNIEDVLELDCKIKSDVLQKLGIKSK